MPDNDKKKEWTVMVYMAGDNSLSEEMIYAIKEMYRIGVDQKIDMLIQFDPSGIGPRVRRFDIGNTAKNKDAKKADADSRGIVNPALDKYQVDIDGRLEQLRDKDFEQANIDLVRRKLPQSGNENSADPKVLKDFVIESIRAHKAHHYMVVLSGHGNGAEGDFLTDLNPADPSKLPGSLSIPHLKWVFDQVRKSGVLKGQTIDILGMDSCLMSTAEVSYEVRDCVKFLVGAEGFESNTGWPYHRILDLLEGPGVEAADVASKLVDTYFRYYTDYEVAGASTDQAACNLESFFTRLVPRVADLATELQSGLFYRAVTDGVLLAHWEAQSYKGEQYVDLFDFCDRLQIRCEAERDALNALPSGPDPKDPEAARLLSNQLDSKQVDRLKALEALKKHDYAPAWQLLYDQLDPEQQKLMDAVRKPGAASATSAMEVLYKQLAPKNQKVIDALNALKTKPRLTNACELLSTEFEAKDPKVEKALGDLRLAKPSFTSASRLLINQLDPKQQRLLHALKNEEADKARRALYAQLGSNQQIFMGALIEKKDLAKAWKLLLDQLSTIAQVCQKVKHAIEQDLVQEGKPRVVLNSCYTGPAFQHSHGLSVYFPWFEEKAVLAEYEKLGFAMDPRIVMREGATDPDIQRVEKRLIELRLPFHRSHPSTEVFTILDARDFDASQFEHWGGVSKIEGTGWAKFLRKYLQATRRQRRDQEDHQGEIPVRIDPPVNSPVAVPVFSAVRTSGHNSRGSSFGGGGMKNLPDGFYQDSREKTDAATITKVGRKVKTITFKTASGETSTIRLSRRKKPRISETVIVTHREFEVLSINEKGIKATITKVDSKAKTITFKTASGKHVTRAIDAQTKITWSDGKEATVAELKKGKKVIVSNERRNARSIVVA